MKIVIIGPAHPLRGGLASYNERLAKEYSTAGHDVQIYTFSLQYPSFLFPGTTQLSTEPPPAGLTIHVVINSINPFNWWRIGRRLRREKPDLVIVRYWLPFMGPCLGTILRLIKKNNHTRAVCIVDNIIPHEKRPGDKPFTRYFVKPVDGFVVMSENVMQDMKRLQIKQPSILVPHPILDNFGEKISKTEARQQLGIPTDVRLLLFFGFIRHYKGLDLLFEALRLLNMQDTSLGKYHLLVAGEFYEDRKPYDDQIAKAGIADQLFLQTEFIPDSKVKYFFGAADVVIQPYRDATQSGVTPLAFHFEVPMIVTRVGGLADLVPHGEVGMVAEPNAAAIAEQIRAYFELGQAHFMPYLLAEKTKYSWPPLVESITRLAGLAGHKDNV
jgi:glycosyltransferase involved in cell wall biosynthesis